MSVESDAQDVAGEAMLEAIKGMPVGAVVVMCDHGEVYAVSLRSNIQQIDTIVFLLETALEQARMLASGMKG